MTEREQELTEALRGLLREFVPSRDKFGSNKQRDAFDAARAAITEATKAENATLYHFSMHDSEGPIHEGLCDTESPEAVAELLRQHHIESLGGDEIVYDVTVTPFKAGGDFYAQGESVVLPVSLAWARQ